MARNKYDVDEIYEEHFDLGQLKRLGRYVLPYKKDMIIAAVLMLSSSAATMLIPRFFMTVMNDMIPNKDVQGLVRISLLTLLVILYSVFALKIKIKITNRVGQTVIHELRNDIFWHLQELPFSYYDDRPHGKIQVRVVNYVNNLSDLLSNGLLKHHHGSVQPDLHHLLHAVHQREADPDVHVRPARPRPLRRRHQEKTAPGLADPEQQAIQPERLYRGKHQRHPRNPVLRPRAGKTAVFSTV